MNGVKCLGLRGTGFGKVYSLAHTLTSYFRPAKCEACQLRSKVALPNTHQTCDSNWTYVCNHTRKQTYTHTHKTHNATVVQVSLCNDDGGGVGDSKGGQTGEGGFTRQVAPFREGTPSVVTPGQLGYSDPVRSQLSCQSTCYVALWRTCWCCR